MYLGADSSGRGVESEPSLNLSLGKTGNLPLVRLRQKSKMIILVKSFWFVEVNNWIAKGKLYLPVPFCPGGFQEAIILGDQIGPSKLSVNYQCKLCPGV